jgi:hypothetical protein
MDRGGESACRRRRRWMVRWGVGRTSRSGREAKRAERPSEGERRGPAAAAAAEPEEELAPRSDDAACRPPILLDTTPGFALTCQGSPSCTQSYALLACRTSERQGLSTAPFALGSAIADCSPSPPNRRAATPLTTEPGGRQTFRQGRSRQWRGTPCLGSFSLSLSQSLACLLACLPCVLHGRAGRDGRWRSPLPLFRRPSENATRCRLDAPRRLAAADDQRLSL